MLHSAASRLAQLAREDLVMFINACLACTGQHEFYDDAYGQRVSIDFLHDYILGNYRLLYARSLAAGINQFNQAQIILKLLATGRHTLPAHRQEEGALIAATLRKFPPQRAWKVLAQLRQQGINNRRSRAIARDYFAQRQDLSFDAVKYRRKVKTIAKHAHLNLTGEVGPFLFHNWKQRTYETKLFEAFRQAHYSADAVYALPFTIAEGLAQKHQIPRGVFLENIQSRMTSGEKLRLQGSAERSQISIDLELGHMPLTKLALYILSLPLQSRKARRAELEQALQKSARQVLYKAPLKLDRVAAVLDCSYSASGSYEKHMRPLGVALGAHALLQVAAQDYRAFWTIPVEDPLLVQARGQTDLATPLLDALDWGANLIVIVSDGCENDPPQGAAQVLQLCRETLDPQRRVSIIHCNPVFNSEDFSLRPLCPLIPTVGLREAEDLPTMLGFARFAEGNAPLAELEDYLAARVQQFLGSV
ncbi:MAG TPA: hypothetical protein V6D19_07580 [Stenomitos sp.]